MYRKIEDRLFVDTFSALSHYGTNHGIFFTTRIVMPFSNFHDNNILDVAARLT
jgi:hypothetical protein